MSEPFTMKWWVEDVRAFGSKRSYGPRCVVWLAYALIGAGLAFSVWMAFVASWYFLVLGVLGPGVILLGIVGADRQS